MRKHIISVAVAALPFSAFAAGSVNETIQTSLPEVVVIDKSIDAPVSDSIATSDTATALSKAPGFSVYSAGGVSGLPALRGLADDRIKIRIDGAELTSACGNHMNAPLSYIDPTLVTVAEVIAGITPVSLGGDNIAGTINLTSAKPLFARPGAGNLTTGSLSLIGRSNDRSVTTSVSGTIASEKPQLELQRLTSQR